MISRLAPSSKDDLAKIHRAALRLLNEAGVAFPGGPALKVFRDHGFRTKGDLVFITEEQLFRHLATVPKTVPMVARNPEKSCLLGGPAPLLFGFGAPIKILSADGSLHPITTADFQAIHKLTQTSPLPQISSYKATSPADIPGQTAHLE